MEDIKYFFDLTKKEQLKLIEKNWDKSFIQRIIYELEVSTWEDLESCFFEELNEPEKYDIKNIEFDISNNFNFYVDGNDEAYVDENSSLDVILKNSEDDSKYKFTLEYEKLKDLRKDVSMKTFLDAVYAIYKKDFEEEDFYLMPVAFLENSKSFEKSMPYIQKGIEFLNRKIEDYLEALTDTNKLTICNDENKGYVLDWLATEGQDILVTEEDELEYKD